MMFTASLGRLGEERHRTGPANGARELALVTGAAARDAPWSDLAALGYEALQSANVLVVDQTHLVDAELANLSTPEATPFDGFRCGWNG